MTLLIRSILSLTFAAVLYAQPQLDFLNHGKPLLDAHNCYPYEGKWADRIDRALKVASQYASRVAIEQDIAWSNGRVVVSHTAKTRGDEPTLKQHFFERVRPLMEDALKKNDRKSWPLIVVHFDFKDLEPHTIRGVWDILGEYEGWITTAKQTANPHELSPFEAGPLLVLTEDADEQEAVFFKAVPVGAKLRVFGSAHTAKLQGASRDEREHMIATTPASQLLTEKPTNYRRWWNNSWHEVEEGGQTKAGDWTAADNQRLKALVDRAHGLGYWIRFYTLDGFTEAESRGWDKGYNFGSREAVAARWKAAYDAGVDLIATDQYEDLARFFAEHK